MADAVHAILEFLHRHDFSVAESALRSELIAREKGNVSLPVAVDDDFDICVNNCLKTMQEKHPAETETFCSEPMVHLSSPGRLQVPESGFSFTRGRPQVPFVDSFSAKVESPNSSSSPRLLKSTFLHTMASDMDQNSLHSGGDGAEINLSKHGSTFLSGATQYVNGAPGSNQQDGLPEEHSSRSNVPMSVAKSDELAFERTTQDGGAMVNFQLVENDVVGRHPWNAERVNLEETSLVGSQQTDKTPADQTGSQQWIGIVDPNESGLHLPVLAGSPWMATSTDSENWGLRHDILEGGQDGFPVNYGVPVLLHDLIANERAPDWQFIAGDSDRVLHRTSGELHSLSSSKEHGAVENGGSKAWKDVPIKTGLPLPPAEIFTAVPLVVEPYAVDESVMIRPPEDTASQEKMRTSGRSSRERAGSADDGSKVLECVSRNFRDAQEELPRLPPVRLRSGESKTAETSKDNHLGSNAKRLPESGVFVNPGASTDSSCGLGSFLDIPVGQDVSLSGARRLSGGSRPSVSQGIVEDASERLTGFAPADGQSDSLADYPDEFWDSDTYDDDDDPGYHRQPIEDEEWFLAHEIEYPDERSSPGLESSRSHHDKDYGKFEDDDHSVLEEESYFSGEEYYRMKRGERREVQNEIERLAASALCSRVEDSQNGALKRQAASQLRETTDFDGQSLDVDDTNMMLGEPVWQGFTAQESGLVKGGDKALNERAREDVGSVRSGGVGISSEVAEFGSEVRGSVVGGSSEGDIDSLKDREVGGYGSARSKEVRKSVSPKMVFSDVEGSQEVGKNVHHVRNSEEQEVDHEMILRYYNETWSLSRANVERQISEVLFEQEKGGGVGSNGNADIHFPQEQELGGFGFGGFSFPSPSSAGDVAVMSRADSGKSLWSVRDVVTLPRGDEGDDYANGIVGPDDTLAVWKRKSNESSPIISPRNETLQNLTLSTDSTISARSTDGYGSGEVKDGEDDEVEGTGINKEEADAVAADDEEAAAVQEQIRRIRAEEEEFETFNLKIVHRKNRTGFEEDKDFPVVINSVIAGRYHVTEYLGSAAFSKAIQAHDLHTGMDVCMKIIKNNKDFFDQSLDEIKLLKYINKHDPGDKYHVLRLYDYFYHREHLFIVCELLRANLYEFHKYNRESGGEVYFTMPRLQSITRQCLEALEFIHGLKLIHCDLKPENILVKSYSRCEVKVIDLGSSCFQTDHLCSYVQSRSYRAPEVILGLPYNQKIDMWSLGCILAELCSGNVLFQNESLATLMARVVGILGPIDQEMLAKGRDTHKLFTKNQMLYERNQETEQLDYLLPKKTSLSHRLPMGDQGFVEFVEYLLQINPAARPTASEALKHTWLSFPYEPISA